MVLSIQQQLISIRHDTTPAYSPECDGVAERRNGILKSRVRSMLKHASLADNWGYWAIDTATYVMNRIICKHTGDKTPYELMMNNVPDVSHLRTFGCLAYIHNERPLNALQSRTIPSMFVE